jgi:small subunit ribosomal protein S11
MADEDKTIIEETTATATATAEAEAPVEATEKKAAPKRKKAKRNVPDGQVHVQASFNNTIITITDKNGNVLTYSSAGACGFRGSKKGTAYAAQVAAERAVQAARQQYGLTRADVLIKGIGLGRDAATRVLAAQDITVDSISDVTGVPHGGVRPRKARRV